MPLLYSQQMPIGWPAPDFELHDGKKKVSLKSFEWAQGLVVLFTCNYCAESEKAWPLIAKLSYKYRNELAFLAINPENSHRFPLENKTETNIRQQELKLKFPFVKDKDQKVAKAFHARSMPEVFLFKHDRPGHFSLFYHGVVDSHFEKSVDRLVAKLDPVAEQPPALGWAVNWI